ncbi:hypothetical protein CKAN_02094700 [Cinnamomum micranthum f. kanehirae]|uniref:Uncharacterized protein n=1 Tax=Cinnamomum micranthum f. kanehirae TaxID=337451 RepID=A0A443PLX4_9MAGN|nr:hypothetical protein CKAN_02094700 [Cinnamomum micranthum f. kanehirae]
MSQELGGIKQMIEMHAFGIPIERFVPTEDDESVAVFNTTAGDKPSNEIEWPCKLMIGVKRLSLLEGLIAGMGPNVFIVKLFRNMHTRLRLMSLTKEMLHCPIQTVIIQLWAQLEMDP